MKNYVYLDNYCGFEKCIIPLEQVNWLVGENSTGKTSFLTIIELVSSPTFWLFEPSFGQKGSTSKNFLDLVSIESKDKHGFTIGIVELGEIEGQRTSRGLLVSYVDHQGAPAIHRVSTITSGEVRTVLGSLWDDEELSYSARYRALTFRDSQSEDTALVKRFAAIHQSNLSFKAQIVPDERLNAPFYLRFADSLFADPKPKGRTAAVPASMGRRSLIELAPIRTKPKNTYDSPQTSFSPEGEHVPYVIRRRLTGQQKADFTKYLRKAGTASGLFKDLTVHQYGTSGDDPFSLRVTLNKTPLKLHNVGYGVSQSLPLLVEMFVRQETAVFSIQQPEVHLHPRAQASFGDVVADLAREEKKSFYIETHSDFAIDRFRLNIRRSNYIPSQLIFFQRDKKGNSAISIPILTDGSLPEKQPAAYRDFFYNEALAMLG